MGRTRMVAAAAGVALCGSAWAVDVYVLDLRQDDFLWFPLANPQSRTFINRSALYDGHALDFDPTAATLHVVDTWTRTVGYIDLPGGNMIAGAPLTGVDPSHEVTGLTFTPRGVAYMSTRTDLYRLDVATGVATLVGPFGTGGMIDIAADVDGDLFGHDIGTDSLYSIDPATGAATLIGPHGLGANFAQGMDFDWETNTLYAAIYTGQGTGRFVSWDTATGAVTMIFDTTPWDSQMEFSFRVAAPGGGCPADFDGNGSLTLNDFVAFRNGYVGGDPRADFDGSGSLTLNDFVQFRNAYVAGCP